MSEGTLSDDRIGTIWKHKKTTDLYVIVGVCRIEASWELSYLYRLAHLPGSTPIARPITEFLDGRFIRVTEGS